MYKVRWKDFGSDDDTWIPEIDLFCPDLLEDFEREYAKRKKTKHRTKRKPAIRQRKKTRGYDSDSYLRDDDDNGVCFYRPERTQKFRGRPPALKEPGLRSGLSCEFQHKI